MKKLLLKLSMLTIVLGMSTNVAWGSTYYQSRLTVSVADGSTGKGKVYVAEGNGALDLSQCAESFEGISQGGDGEGAGEESSFTIYAVAERGKMFTSWSDISGDGSPAFASGFSASTNPAVITMIKATNEAYTNTESPWDTYYWNAASISANFDNNPVPAWGVKFLPAANGTYSVVGPTGYDSPITLSEETVHSTYDNDIFRVSATPSAGYAFYRFVGSDGSNTYTIGAIGVANQTLNIPMGTTSVTAEFTNKPFMVNGIICANLADAIQTSRQDDGSYSGIILLINNAAVEGGYYTIPEGVTLLIPKNAEQRTPDGYVVERNHENLSAEGAYCTLTLENGVNIEVYGTIEVAGTQGMSNGGADEGYPVKKFGHMIMKPGSHITLNNGAKLYAWGFITGDNTKDAQGNYLSGDIDVRRGAEVREQFQIRDWKGGTYTSNLMNDPDQDRWHDERVFPVIEYFVQNVEVPTTYRPGSVLLTAASIYVPSFDTEALANNAQLMGVYYGSNDPRNDVAMFLMDNEDESEDTWVRKRYDPKTDQQVYEVNNSAHLGSITIGLSAAWVDYTLTSSYYVLPLTNNMKIHLLNGNMDITQDAVLLPGTELEIDKKCTFTVSEGNTLYMYDSNQWGTYVYDGAYGKKVKYRPFGVPTVRTVNSAAGLGDASINIHGTLDIAGALYTTTANDIIGGAHLYSATADAGTVKYSSNAPTDTTKVYQWKKTSYYGADAVSALLTNDAGSTYGTFSQTAGTAAGQSYCFIDMDNDGKGEWVSLTSDGCWAHDQYGVYYIKPQDYLPISVGEPVEKDDHTYRDEYGNTGRIFINTMAGGYCQWWEVEAVEGQPNLFHCKHPKNNTYYYWHSVIVSGQDQGYWEEKRFNITFKNWDGTVLTFVNTEDKVQDHYELTYGSMPNWLSANPERPADADFTYNFTGWTPALDEVTSDQTYVATYSKTPVKYTIIYKFDETYNDGAEIKRELLERNANPTPPTTTREGYYIQWTPALSAVTGNQTYTAQWLSTEPTEYNITFYDYDGTTVLKQGNVNVGEEPTPPSDPTGKPATKDYTYVFDHWSPTVATVSHNSPKTYTAIYASTPRKYSIKFVKENGNPAIPADVLSTQDIVYGAMPNVPNYSKENPAEHTEYTLVWTPIVSAATQDQVYTATFTSKTQQFKVEWKNGEEVLDMNYFDYNTTPVYYGTTPTKEDAENFYTFSNWSPAISAVTADQVYTAQFSATPKATSLTINNTNPQTPAADQTVQATTITIETNGSVDLSATNTKLMADNLILESTGTVSGQIKAATTDQVKVTNAYFDLRLNAKNHKWYAVAVPWQVSATNGISVNGKTLVLGKDFDIIYYDGARRAAEGKKKCWKYVENDGDKTLQPGRLYMIGLMMDAPTIRFAKKAYASLLTTSTSVSEYPQTTGDATDANWNGVANPALFHAFVNPGVIAAQVYNPESNGYDPIEMDDAKFVVGQGAFVQAPADKSIVVTTSDSYPVSAPRRARAEEAPLYDVRIAPAEAEYTDRLFVRVEDEKEADTYVIGKDLAKLGVSKAVAQMWINRYNTELCLNTMTMENGVAEYPLSIFAPKTGEYTISSQSSVSSDQYTLYLTFNGEAIWNLSEGAYTLELTQGNTTNYGLRVSARAPQITTGIDEAVVDAKGETRKVLINDKVFIIRGEHIYSADGQLVK